ncbi:LOW QUALITY PROTEIN: ZN676-like protein [Mya arenaria]|uniref:ZN676-like protein n=1 Tax=Mya arenaria TaxID=6604 RepID=A0ABY7EDV6_MYAAR|nr:LOW QUALITY PROTEIN: ZN676-like protein [Mya arenaria]
MYSCPQATYSTFKPRTLAFKPRTLDVKPRSLAFKPRSLAFKPPTNSRPQATNPCLQATYSCRQATFSCLQATYSSFKPRTLALKPRTLVFKPCSHAVKPRTLVFKQRILAVKPRSVAFKPRTLAVKPRSLAFKPRSLAFKPRTLAFKPRTLALKPLILAFKPQMLAFKPRTLAVKPRTLAVKPLTLAFRPRTLALKPRTVAFKPRTLAVKPRSLAFKPRTLALKPRSLAFKPRTIAFKPRTVALKPCTLAVKPRTLAFKPRTLASKPHRTKAVHRPYLVGLRTVPKRLTYRAKFTNRAKAVHRSDKAVHRSDKSVHRPYLVGSQTVPRWFNDRAKAVNKPCQGGEQTVPRRFTNRAKAKTIRLVSLTAVRARQCSAEEREDSVWMAPRSFHRFIDLDLPDHTTIPPSDDRSQSFRAPVLSSRHRGEPWSKISSSAGTARKHEGAMSPRPCAGNPKRGRFKDKKLTDGNVPEPDMFICYQDQEYDNASCLDITKVISNFEKTSEKPVSKESLLDILQTRNKTKHQSKDIPESDQLEDIGKSNTDNHNLSCDEISKQTSEPRTNFSSILTSSNITDVSAEVSDELDIGEYKPEIEESPIPSTVRNEELSSVCTHIKEEVVEISVESCTTEQTTETRDISGHVNYQTEHPTACSSPTTHVSNGSLSEERKDNHSLDLEKVEIDNPSKLLRTRGTAKIRRDSKVKPSKNRGKASVLQADEVKEAKIVATKTPKSKHFADKRKKTIQKKPASEKNNRGTLKATLTKQKPSAVKDDSEITVYKCSECDYQGTKRKRLTEHMGRVHGLLTEACKGSQLQSNFSCDQCEKVFVFGKDLSRHKRIVHHAERFHCEVCGKTYKARYVFDRHMATHADGYVQPMFKCEEHRYMHDQVRRFSCQQCGKAFRQKTCLIIHQKVHSNKKENVCRFCGRAFSQKQSLLRHERIHTGDKPYQCRLCQREFSDAAVVRKHILMVHKCDKDGWKQHIIKTDGPISDHYIEGGPGYRHNSTVSSNTMIGDSDSSEDMTGGNTSVEGNILSSEQKKLFDGNFIKDDGQTLEVSSDGAPLLRDYNSSSAFKTPSSSASSLGADTVQDSISSEPFMVKREPVIGTLDSSVSSLTGISLGTHSYPAQSTVTLARNYPDSFVNMSYSANGNISSTHLSQHFNTNEIQLSDHFNTNGSRAFLNSSISLSSSEIPGSLLSDTPINLPVNIPSGVAMETDSEAYANYSQQSSVAMVTASSESSGVQQWNQLGYPDMYYYNSHYPQNDTKN